MLKDCRWLQAKIKKARNLKHEAFFQGFFERSVLSLPQYDISRHFFNATESNILKKLMLQCEIKSFSNYAAVK